MSRRKAHRAAIARFLAQSLVPTSIFELFRTVILAIVVLLVTQQLLFFRSQAVQPHYWPEVADQRGWSPDHTSSSGEVDIQQRILEKKKTEVDPLMKELLEVLQGTKNEVCKHWAVWI